MRLAQDAFQLAVESVQDYAIFVLDPEGHVATWNAGARRIKQYLPEEIIGRHFSVFHLAEDIAAGKPARELAVVRAEGRVQDEGWRLRKDGTRFWANVVVTALRDADDNLVGFSKITRDLTDRRQAEEAEEALHLAEERFRLLVEGVSDYAIYMLDPDGRVSTWNSGARNIKGYATSEILGQHFSRFFTDADVEVGRPERELQTARTKGRFEEEGWRVRKDGSKFWASITITALRDARGELIGFAKVTRDLTAKNAADRMAREEAILVEERERYKALHRRLEVIFEGVDEGITVEDHGGHVTFANTAAARLGGFDTAEQLMAAMPADLCTRFDLFDEEGQPFSLAELPARKVLAGADVASTILRIRDRQNGHEWWSMVRATPVRDPAGKTELAISLWHDVTAARRREENDRYLARATATLSSSLDYRSMMTAFAGLLVPGRADWCSIHVIEDGRLRNVAVAHVDPDKVALALDYESRYPSDLTSESGLASTVRTGRSVLYADVTDDMLQAGARDEKHLALLRGVGMRSVILAPIVFRERVTGTISLIAAESGRRYDADDVALAEELGRRAATAIQNASLFAAERLVAARAEEAARRAEDASRIKDEFLATVSHELRTPLNAIIGWASLLRTRADDASLAKGIEVIHRNALAQGKIIEDILDVSRIITGKLRLDLREADLRTMLDHAIEVVLPSASAKGIAVSCVAPRPGAGLVVVDTDRMQQVLWNLLSNAVKFTDRGGTVTIELRRSSSTITVVVTDSGQGIDAAVLPHVFDRFQQADSSTTRRVGGLGLGLAIVRHIVELHGGQVSARSDGLGKGSTFEVVLPLRGATGAQEDDTVHSSATPSRTPASS